MATPFLLAPMAELSHRALRELIEGFGFNGADEYFTEMISAGGIVNGGSFESWYMDNGPCPEKLVYQIAGGDEEMLLRALVLLDRKDCLGIDVNMGCSAPAIVRTGAGVRWMSDIEKSGALIRRLRPHTKRRLSVKLRTGPSDDFDYLVRFCRRLEEEGVDLITLHPRTAKEKFKRKARWDYVSALRKELHVPLAGNGDIASAEEMLSRSSECDAVMIGRLAVRRPWVFAEAKGKAKNFTYEPYDHNERVWDQGSGNREQGTGNGELYQLSKHEDIQLCFRTKIPVPGPQSLIFETGLRFLELLAKYQPPEFHISRARRFFGYFCDNLKWGTYVKNLLNRETDLSGIERIWKTCFSGSPLEY